MNYLPITEADKKAMLEKIGISSTEELFADIPDAIRFKGELNIPEGKAEYEVKKKLTSLSSQNCTMDEYVSYLGAGAYDHYMPALVDHILQRSEWYTAYTPYQPEISQGTLQSIFEYQTMVCELFAMDVSNASVYDGATALAEAMIMTCDRKKEIIVSKGVHPEYIETLDTYAYGKGVDVKLVELEDGLTPLEGYKKLINKNTGAVVIQYPNFFGCIEDVKSLADLAHENGSNLIVVMGDVVSLGILEAPGNLGADIVVGDGMSFAGPINFSGPSIGMIACKEELTRKLPGRIAGITTDSQGNRAYVLTLQAREQHIRREKASSCICSNQALHALATNITLSTLGKKGLKDMATTCLQNSNYAMERFTAIDGVELAYKKPFFDEFTLKLPISAKLLNKRLLKHGIFGCVDLGRFNPEHANMGLFYTAEFLTKSKIEHTAEIMEVIFNETVR